MRPRGRIAEGLGSTAGLGAASVAATLDRLDGAGAQVDRARRRAGEVLDVVAHSAWTEVVWRWSWLTNTGFPLEFGWTGRDAAIRWTAEVAPPEVPNGDRFALARALAFGAGASGERLRATLERTAALQDGVRLRFGAWLGMRHRADGDQAKVYAELPGGPAAEVAARLGLPRCPALRTIGLRSRMLGILGDGSVELYTRSSELTPAAVAGLEASLFGRVDRLRPRIEQSLNVSRLPQPSGVSVAFGPDGGPVAVTWFCFAKAIFGSDADAVQTLAAGTVDEAARRRLRALAAGEPDGRWRCGMVGVGVAGTGESWLQVGMRPG